METKITVVVSHCGRNLGYKTRLVVNPRSSLETIIDFHRRRSHTERCFIFLNRGDEPDLDPAKTFSHYGIKNDDKIYVVEDFSLTRADGGSFIFFVLILLIFIGICYYMDYRNLL